MVGRADHHRVAGQTVHLHEQRGNQPFDLTGFLRVAALLSDRIEFVEEQHAWVRGRVLDQLTKSVRRFAQVTVHDGVVPQYEQRQAQLAGQRLSKARLSVAWWAHQKNGMPGLKRMRAQQGHVRELVDELGDLFGHA